MPRLVMINSPDSWSIELADRTIVIGRLPECEIVLNDPLISRRHAEIKKVGDRYRILDLSSLNGVYVNNLRVYDEPLSSGDIITAGNAQILFEEPKAKEAAATFKASSLEAGLGGLDKIMSGEGEIIKSVKRISEDMHLEDELPSSSIKATGMIRIPEKGSQSYYVLYQIGRVLNNVNSLDELLEQTMPLIFQVINAERGVIMVIDQEGRLVPRVSQHRDRTVNSEEIRVSQTIARKALEEKVSIITADAKYDERFQSGQSIMEYNIRSALCVPLWEQDTVRGVIYLDNLMQTYAFNEGDRDLLTAIANQVAIGMRHEEMKQHMKQEAVVRANLERFHSPDVVNMIMQKSYAHQDLKQQVEDREVTVMFGDIVGFTSMSEWLKPQEVADLLVDYFNEISKIIFNYKGTIDKFIGDCVMAIFGAPLSYGNDAEMSIRSAIDIMHKLEEFRTCEDKRRHLIIRIGINTGRVVVGYLGSSTRLEYSVLGDTVNVAARLESNAPHNGILIGEDTYKKVKDLFEFKDLGLISLKGKQNQVRVYEVLY